MSTKVQFELVVLEVEKMYAEKVYHGDGSHFTESEIAAIEDQCLKIDNFIESCGWSVENFLDKWNNGQSN